MTAMAAQPGGMEGPSLTDRVRRLQREARELEVGDSRTAEEILGYDTDGLPT